MSFMPGGDLRKYRQALGRYATGVAIVTASPPDGTRIGLTINSFASVSLDPALVLWSLDNRSASLSSIRGADGFTINVLAADQMALANRFARPMASRFDGTAHEISPRGNIYLPDALAVFECETYDVLAGGDHSIFLGQVRHYRVREDAPLVYSAGRFVTELAPLPERAQA